MHYLHTSTKPGNERKNRTMVEYVTDKRIKNYFWCDAVATAVYILNLSPTSALHMMTPYEAYYEKNPNVNHFNFFGCLAYVYVDDEKRQKLHPKN